MWLFENCTAEDVFLLKFLHSWIRITRLTCHPPPRLSIQFLLVGCLNFILASLLRYLVRASSSTARVQLQEPSPSSVSPPSSTPVSRHSETDADNRNKTKKTEHTHILLVRPSARPPPIQLCIWKRRLPLILTKAGRKWRNARKGKGEEWAMLYSKGMRSS